MTETYSTITVGALKLICFIDDIKKANLKMREAYDELLNIRSSQDVASARGDELWRIIVQCKGDIFLLEQQFDEFLGYTEIVL